MIDLETTGLNSKTCEVIEMSALRVKDSVIVDQYSTLVRPIQKISSSVTKINNITNEMVAEERGIDKCLPEFMEYIGSSKLLGYNIASYDIPILKRLCQSLNITFENDYIDILPMARKMLSFLPSRKLSDVAAFFKIDVSGAHRALIDCEMTKECYEKLVAMEPPKELSCNRSGGHRAAYSEQTKSLQHLHAILLGILADDILEESEVKFLSGWLEDNSFLLDQFPFNRISEIIKNALADGVIEQFELDEMLILFKKYLNPLSDMGLGYGDFDGKVFCLTGDFESGLREDIKQFIEANGGIVRGSVSSKTDYLLVGALGSPSWAYGNYGSKIQKAMEIQDKGGKVKIIAEKNICK